MGVVDEFAALYAAVTGTPAGDSVMEAIRAICELAGGGGDRFPRYLRKIAMDLVARRTCEATTIPKCDHGWAWLLREISPLLPGSEFRDEVGRDVFVLPSLGLAVVVTRGPAETFSILPWSQREDSLPGTRVVLGTFDPTFDQVRLWAYSPDMRLTTQDEEVAVSHPRYLPLLIELAADPACPKRRYLLSIADGLVAAVGRGGFDRELIDRARVLAASTSAPELVDWSRGLAYLAAYLDSHGSVPLEAAREVMRIIFTGRYRTGVVVRESSVENWWEFTASFPEGDEIDRLYVSQPSGALVWSKRPLSVADLAPHGNPPKRDDPLQEAI